VYSGHEFIVPGGGVASIMAVAGVIFGENILVVAADANFVNIAEVELLDALFSVEGSFFIP